MSSASLANLSETLAWMAVLSYVVAAVLLGLEFAYRIRWTGLAGVAVATAGLAANVGAAVTRGLAAHRVPWGNMYEFSIMVGVVTVTGFLVWVVRKPEVRPLGMFVLLPAVLAVAPARGAFPLRRRPPPLVAGGARTADRVEVREAIASYLEEEAAPAADGPAAAPPRRVWDRMPAARTLDELAYRTTAFGFPIWTFAIIAGAIWAQSAWGRYWGWDPKETWSFISWTIYAAYLHARATAGWRGRRAAVAPRRPGPGARPGGRGRSGS